MQWKKQLGKDPILKPQLLTIYWVNYLMVFSCEMGTLSHAIKINIK